MGEIDIQDIVTGMEIAEDIYNINGALLIKAGTVLTEKHLRHSITNRLPVFP